MKYTLFALAALAAVTPAWAGKRILMESTDLVKNATTQREILLDATRLRMNDGDTSILFLTNGGDRMLVLDKTKNQYQEIDKAMMDQMGGAMAEMAKMMQNIPPEQRAMMEQMMKGKMGGMTGAAAPKPTYAAKGAATVNGFACTNYEESEAGRKTAELCVAAPGALNINPADFKVMERMQAFSESIMSSMSQMVPRTGSMRSGLNGLPVQTVEYTGGKASSREQLKSVSNVTLSDADFSLGSATKVEMGGRAAKGLPKGKAK